MSGYDVARESLNVAETSLKNNRTRVEVGTMAPIDITAAEAEKMATAQWMDQVQ